MSGSAIAWSVFGAYAGTSAFLLVFPTLLHCKKKSVVEKRIVHASHRGGSAEAPENTLHAFRNAVVQGTRMLELDVHLTKDRQVVVHHDASLLRTTGRAASIVELEFSELPPLKETGLQLPSFYHPDGALLQWQKPEGEEGAPIRIPLLREVFETFPASFINIDLKGSVPEDDPSRTELRTRVHELIVQHGRQDRTAWGSFSSTVCEACREQNPEVH